MDTRKLLKMLKKGISILCKQERSRFTTYESLQNSLTIEDAYPDWQLDLAPQKAQSEPIKMLA